MRQIKVWFTIVLSLAIVLATSFSLLAQDDIEAAHKELLHRIIDEAFNQGDLSVIDELFAEDYINHVDGNNIEDRDDFKDFISTFRTAMPDYESRVEMLIAEGDWLSFRFTSIGTFENEMASFPGVPPTGEPVELVVYVIVRFNEEGQIAEEWDLLDSLGFLTQMGVLPPMEE